MNIMQMRRGMGAKGIGPLPYDAEIEYLESTGTQYIMLPIYPTSHQIYDIEVAKTSGTPNNAIYFGVRWYGTATDFNSQCYFNTNISFNNQFVLWSTRADLGYYGNYYTGVYATEVNKMYTLTGMTCTNLMTVSTYPTMLFGFNILGTKNSNVGICRIGYFRIRDNYGTIIELIPVRVGSVGYMYDKVSRQLFGNAGTGAFILGPDK